MNRPFSTREQTGVPLSLTANAAWALQALYWPLLAPSGPAELLAYRVVCSGGVCLLCTVLLRQRRELFALVRQTRQCLLLGLAGLCLTGAWGVYIVGVNSGHVVETSLGLFMVPLTSVLVGVFFLREKLGRWQWVAIGIATIATGIVTIGYGRLPWIGLVICTLMAFYALIKKHVGAPALPGFTLECLLMTVPALAFIGWLGFRSESTVGRVSPLHTMLVVASGVVTAIPLLAHAGALNRLSLTAVGVLQYLNPTGQFFIGIVILHEDMSALRWLGFGLVWSALTIFTGVAVRQSRRARRTDSGAHLPQERSALAEQIAD